VMGGQGVATLFSARGERNVGPPGGGSGLGELTVERKKGCPFRGKKKKRGRGGGGPEG